MLAQWFRSVDEMFDSVASSEGAALGIGIGLLVVIGIPGVAMHSEALAAIGLGLCAACVGGNVGTLVANAVARRARSVTDAEFVRVRRYLAKLFALIAIIVVLRMPVIQPFLESIGK